MINTTINIALESSLDKKETILRDLAVIFGTRKGEQALDRKMGIDWSCLDQPMEVAKAMLSADVIAQVAAYVPAVFVSSIDFAADEMGHLTPTVRVEEVENE